jgi:hypothetical protein
MEQSVNTEVLCLQTDSHLNWKNHIDKLVPELSGACYTMLHISNTVTLKSIYFTHFQSTTKYGIFFWGNSSNNKNIFMLQKKLLES